MSYMKEMLDAVYQALVSDTELQTLSGGTVRLRYRLAEYNEPFPYLVYMVRDVKMRFDDNVTAYDARIDFDIWTYSEDHSIALSIQAAVIRLLHMKHVNTAGGTARWWFDRSMNIPVDRDDNFKEPTVGRLKLVFFARFIDNEMIINAVY